MVFALYLNKKNKLTEELHDYFYVVDEAVDTKTYKTAKNALEEMAIAAGLGFCPKLVVVKNFMPSIFSLGTNAENSKVFITTSILEELNRSELQGAFAHEIAHIKNMDCLLATEIFSMLYYINYFAGVFIFTNTSGDERTGDPFLDIDRTPDVKKLNPYLIYLYIFNGTIFATRLCIGVRLAISAACLLILAPIFNRTLFKLLSKDCDYLADAYAVQFTRYPIGLYSALNKIQNYGTYKERFLDTILNNARENKKMDLAYVPYAYELIMKAKFKSDNFLLNYTNNFSFTPDPNKNDDAKKEIVKRMAILKNLTGSGLLDYAFATENRSLKKILQNSDDARHENIIKIDEIKQKAVVGLIATELISEFEEEQTKLERHIEINDSISKKEEYKVIKCDCETTIKIPKNYLAFEVTCPHCKKKYLLKDI